MVSNRFQASDKMRLLRIQASVGGVTLKRFYPLLVCCLVLVIVSCTLPREETGSLVVKILVSKVIPETEPSRGIVMLSKGVRSLSRSFEFPGQSSINFQSIEKGVWDVSVVLKDEQDHILYVGQAQVEVLPGVQNVVSVPMILNTADLQIDIFVTSTEVASVKLELFYSDDIRIFERDLRNGTASLQLENLPSVVWNVKFTLYDEDRRQILVWPEKGSFGLELQPGRLNRYSFTIDQFGHVGVKMEVELIETVSSATLTNVEDGIQISWDPMEKASYYQIYRKEGDHWVEIFKGTETSYLDKDVVENFEYSYVFNVVTVDGKHSGFSKVFTVVRDIPRIFVAFQDGSLVRYKLVDSRIEQKASNNVSNMKMLRAVRNDLFVVTDNSVVRLNTENLNEINSQKHNLFLFGSNFSLNDKYLVQISSNTVIRLSIYNPASITTTQLDGACNYVSLDRHLIILKGATVQVLDPETLQLITSKNIDGAQRVFTKGDLVFVLCERNNSFVVEIYRLNGTSLDPVQQSINSPGDVRSLDVSNDFFCFGIYNKGVYLGKIGGAQLKQISSTHPVALKIVGQNLHILYSNKLEIHSVNLDSLTTTLVASSTFSKSCLTFFAD